MSNTICSGGFVIPTDGPCPKCSAWPDDYCAFERVTERRRVTVMEDEITRLCLDIERHISIARDMATDNERLRAEVERLRNIVGCECPECQTEEERLIDAAMAGGANEKG